MVSDGEYLPSIMALLLTTISWFYDRKFYGSYTQTLINKN